MVSHKNSLPVHVHETCFEQSTCPWNILSQVIFLRPLLKGYHLDVVGGPSSIPYDPESDAGGNLSSW
jgi:hypothetical protein